MHFEIVGKIIHIDTIAIGHRIRELDRLKRVYGPGRWRQRKGIAKIRIGSGRPFMAELHWYEAHGIGRKEYKIKRMLEG